MNRPVIIKGPDYTGITAYISGPISGLPLEQAKRNFQLAENYLSGYGIKSVNPLNLSHDLAGPWQDFMKVDIKALMNCNAIYLLKGWEDSRGAVIEAGLAQELNYFFSFQSELRYFLRANPLFTTDNTKRF